MRSLISYVALIKFVGSATEVEILKSTLAQAKEQARVCQAAADKAAADLKAEQCTRCKYEERVTEVE